MKARRWLGGCSFVVFTAALALVLDFASHRQWVVVWALLGIAAVTGPVAAFTVEWGHETD